MKSIYLSAIVICTMTLAGCASEDSSLAEEDITADEIAKYEEELAAVTGDDAFTIDESADDAE